MYLRREKNWIRTYNELQIIATIKLNSPIEDQYESLSVSPSIGDYKNVIYKIV